MQLVEGRQPEGMAYWPERSPSTARGRSSALTPARIRSTPRSLAMRICRLFPARFSSCAVVNLRVQTRMSWRRGRTGRRICSRGTAPFMRGTPDAHRSRLGLGERFSWPSALRLDEPPDLVSCHRAVMPPPRPGPSVGETRSWSGQRLSEAVSAPLAVTRCDRRAHDLCVPPSATIEAVVGLVGWIGVGFS